jgi:hypothetical protein
MARWDAVHKAQMSQVFTDLQVTHLYTYLDTVWVRVTLADGFGSLFDKELPVITWCTTISTVLDCWIAELIRSLAV